MRSRGRVALPKICPGVTWKRASWPIQSRMSSQDQRGVKRPLGKVNKKPAKQGQSTTKLPPETKKASCKKALGGPENPLKIPAMPVVPIVMKTNEAKSPNSSEEVPHSRQKISMP